MALFPTPEESCFYLDPNEGLTDGNLWKDSSPFGLHVTPVGYAAPAYGIFTGPSGAKAISFNGANQYGTLPLRFYDNAPTTEITIACVAQHTSPVSIGRIFACRNGAGTAGYVLAYGVTPTRTEYYCSPGGVDSIETNTLQIAARTRVTVASQTSSRSSRRWHDREQYATTDAGIAQPAFTYDVALNPRIACEASAVAWLMNANVYFLGIWPRVWTHAEAVAFSDYWMDRT